MLLANMSQKQLKALHGEEILAGDHDSAASISKFMADGDTIKVLLGGTQVKIRLYGIDTPERRQAFGNRAKQFTSGQVFGKTVKAVPMDADRCGRTVALVQSLDDTVTLNEALVKQGYAWVYRKYCKADFCPEWLDQERTAQASNRGLWTDPDPIPPWQYRKRK